MDFREIFGLILSIVSVRLIDEVYNINIVRDR